MNVTFGTEKTKYKGNRLKVATVKVNGTTTTLGLGDTSRCAQSVDAATRTLANLAKAAGAEDWAPAGEPEQLHAHCREVLGLPPAAEAS